jgi:hypothetical protein
LNADRCQLVPAGIGHVASLFNVCGGEFFCRVAAVRYEISSAAF